LPHLLGFELYMSILVLMPSYILLFCSNLWC
jgi:hypothetical protein